MADRRVSKILKDKVMSTLCDTGMPVHNVRNGNVGTDRTNVTTGNNGCN